MFQNASGSPIRPFRLLALSVRNDNHSGPMVKQRNPVGWFEIYVDDLARAQAFYESVFQVKLQPLDSPAIKMLAFPMQGDLPGCTGSLVKIPGGGRPTGNAVIIYFTCQDCAVEATRAAQHGGKIFKEKFSIGDYGFISLVHDTEGNMIGLHSLK
jgi:uncharacterized protein